jgi:hypothetical protein
MQILQEQYICHRVPTITMGIWLLCRLLITLWMVCMQKIQELFSVLRLINEFIAEPAATGFHLIRFSLWVGWKPKPGRLD